MQPRLDLRPSNRPATACQRIRGVSVRKSVEHTLVGHYRSEKVLKKGVGFAISVRNRCQKALVLQCRSDNVLEQALVLQYRSNKNYCIKSRHRFYDIVPNKYSKGVLFTSLATESAAKPEGFAVKPSPVIAQPRIRGAKFQYSLGEIMRNPSAARKLATPSGKEKLAFYYVFGHK